MFGQVPVFIQRAGELEFDLNVRLSAHGFLSHLPTLRMIGG